MITENLSTLKIHKLTQEQYDRELEAGRIDETALYLTPDDGIVIDDTLSVAGMAADAKKTGDAVSEAKTIANNALNKANAAQTALGFTPVQQGFKDGTGGNKIRLGWKEAPNGQYGIGIEVDNSFVGYIVSDSATYGAVAPIAKGGTGATTRADALKNLNASSGTPTYTDLCYAYLQNTGLATAPITTQAVLEAMPASSSITFTHHNGQTAYLSDAPFSYGIVTLKKGVNSDFMECAAIDIATGIRYEYRYHRSSNTHRNGWRRILTNQLSTYDYGTSLPSSGVTGQIYHVKG